MSILCGTILLGASMIFLAWLIWQLSRDFDLFPQHESKIKELEVKIKLIGNILERFDHRFENIEYGLTKLKNNLANKQEATNENETNA